MIKVQQINMATSQKRDYELNINKTKDKGSCEMKNSEIGTISLTDTTEEDLIAAERPSEADENINENKEETMEVELSKKCKGEGSDNQQTVKDEVPSNNENKEETMEVELSKKCKGEGSDNQQTVKDEVPSNNGNQEENKVLDYKKLIILGLLLLTWYVSSIGNMLLGNFIKIFPTGNTKLLGLFNIITSTVLTVIHFLFLFYKIEHNASRNLDLKAYILFLSVGFIRFFTIFFGIIGLDETDVFVIEMLKALCPIFTFIFSSWFLDETCNYFVLLSFLPIIIGNIISFIGSSNYSVMSIIIIVSSVVLEALQNCISKYLTTNKNYGIKSIDVQLISSSIAALGYIFYFLYYWMYLVDGLKIDLMEYYVSSGFIYHIQITVAFCLIDLITPLVYSIYNNVKRVVLIIIAVIVLKKLIDSLLISAIICIGSGVVIYAIVANLEITKKLGNFKFGTCIKTCKFC